MRAYSALDDARKEADAARKRAWSGGWREIIAFDRAAERHQLAAMRPDAIERVESGVLT